MSRNGSLVAGFAEDRVDGRRWLALASFRADGSPERRFGRGGVVAIPTDGRGFPYDVARSNGRILIACGGCRVGAKRGVRLLALRRDGSLDRSFGRGGLTFAPGKGTGDRRYPKWSTVAVQSDGRILLSAPNGRGAGSVVVRYLVTSP